MEDKKVGMIDMDEVIVDKRSLKVANDYLGTNYTLDNIKGFYIQNIIPKEQQEDFWDFFFSKNVYDYAEILPNAYEVMEELMGV